MTIVGHTILIDNLHSNLLIIDKAFREALCVHMQDLAKSWHNNLLTPIALLYNAWVQSNLIFEHRVFPERQPIRHVDPCGDKLQNLTANWRNTLLEQLVALLKDTS